MSVSDEAVEAAAMAIFGVDRATWDLQVPEIRERYLGEARDALEAAAPFIRAQALEEASDIAGRPENRWWAEGQNRARWLRNLAAAERGSK